MIFNLNTVILISEYLTILDIMNLFKSEKQLYKFVTSKKFWTLYFKNHYPNNDMNISRSVFDNINVFYWRNYLGDILDIQKLQYIEIQEKQQI